VSGTEHRGGIEKCCIIVGDGCVGCFSDDCDNLGLVDILSRWREAGKPYIGPIWVRPQPAFTFEDEVLENESDGRALVQPPPTDSAVKIAATLTVDETEEKVGEFECESNPKHLSHIDNGARLAKGFGNNIHNVVEADAWYRWTGRRWKHDKTLRIFKMAKATVMKIAEEADVAGRVTPKPPRTSSAGTAGASRGPGLRPWSGRPRARGGYRSLPAPWTPTTTW
jgi:hypothetical protein